MAVSRSVFGDDLDSRLDVHDHDHTSNYSTESYSTESTVQAESVQNKPHLNEPRLMEDSTQNTDVWTDYASSGAQWDATQSSELYPNSQESTADTEPKESEHDFFGYDDSADFNSYSPPVTSSGRDMRLATLVGVTLIGALIGAVQLGPVVVLCLVLIALGLAAMELYNALRIADHQPAVLLGLAAVVCMPLAVYWRGITATTVVLVMTVIFGALWYLTGVGSTGIVRGLSSTLLGVCYIGLLGSHAALILKVPDDGLGLLVASIAFTVAYDVGGLVIGKSAGRNPLSRVSPNKTLEGYVGGCVATLLVGLGMGIMGMPAPVASDPGGIWTAIWLAIAAAVVAPVGDLAESALKRDLGIKDMGTLLPGHGGALDRFDGHLFVMPVIYYMALLTGII